MILYHNTMEQIVEDAYDMIKHELDCCTCERCRNDIIAYALNHLPPKYVVTAVGQAYSKLESLKIQQNADIIAAISQGASVVKQHPRHNEPSK